MLKVDESVNMITMSVDKILTTGERPPGATSKTVACDPFVSIRLRRAGVTSLASVLKNESR